jgi:hypothetical protein
MTDDLDSEFAAAGSTVAEGKKAVDDRIRGQQADDRSVIAKLIVWSFVGMVGWVVFAGSLGAFLRDWNSLVEPAKFMLTILGSVMLPVVTLVIGYYFGKEK